MAGHPAAVPNGDGPDEGDVSLIRWMLSLTPAERLDVLDRHVADVLKLRARNEGTSVSEAAVAMTEELGGLSLLRPALDERRRGDD